jgi:hypothetical protein
MNLRFRRKVFCGKVSINSKKCILTFMDKILGFNGAKRPKQFKVLKLYLNLPKIKFLESIF